MESQKDYYTDMIQFNWKSILAQLYKPRHPDKKHDSADLTFINPCN